MRSRDVPPPRAGRRVSSERGSATVAAAAAIALALVVSLFALDLWRAVLARSRAQAAADAAALAAAGAMAAGQGHSAIAEAERYAERAGARLESCRCDAGSMEAVVTVRLEFAVVMVPGATRSVTAAARAVVDGPVIRGDTEGLQPWFASRVSCLVRMVPGVTVVSGFRTREEQARLYAEKPGLAAPPGRSLHEVGLAVDLAFPTPATEARAHALAPVCGLGFGVPGEPWHASPLGME